MSKQARRKTAADRYADHYHDGYVFGRKEMLFDMSTALHDRLKQMRRRGRYRDASVGLELVKWLLDHAPEGQNKEGLFPTPEEMTATVEPSEQKEKE